MLSWGWYLRHRQSIAYLVNAQLHASPRREARLVETAESIESESLSISNACAENPFKLLLSNVDLPVGLTFSMQYLGCITNHVVVAGVD